MRTNDFFLVAAAASVMMLAACTHDDGTLSTASPASNEIVITTRSSEMGFTRAESNIQSTQFDNGQEIHIFLRDATVPANSTDGTLYEGSPYTYIKEDADETGRTIKTYVSTVEQRLYWPKLMHPLDIYGIYPINAVSDGTKVDGTFLPFDKTKSYYFTVQSDQSSEVNYKLSDLMTGLPTTYNSVKAATYNPTSEDADAPFKLIQKENPGTIPLTFTHRLTKIIINITKTTETKDVDIPMADIICSDGSDTRYAIVTLTNVKRKTQFKVNSADPVDKTNIASVTPDEVRVGQGATPALGDPHLTNPNNPQISVTLAAILPPQVIAAEKPFIKIELVNRTGDSAPYTETPYETFKYAIPAGGLELLPGKVHVYNIRINKPHIDVSTTINDWLSAGDPVSEIGTLQ